MNENGCRDFVRHRQNIPHDNNQSPYINSKKYQFRNQFDLAKQNALFEDEVSNYQSALGVIINFQLSDDDQNYGVKLNNTISELNDNIKKYIINLKQDTVVNMEEVKTL
ncbi:14240_t:CDS:2 [Rhizophagus irregularis]|nr:14240_t:CDS:2 [Rhizophagus irregularis]